MIISNVGKKAAKNFLPHIMSLHELDVNVEPGTVVPVPYIPGDCEQLVFTFHSVRVHEQGVCGFISGVILFQGDSCDDVLNFME